MRPNMVLNSDMSAGCPILTSLGWGRKPSAHHQVCHPERVRSGGRAEGSAVVLRDLYPAQKMGAPGLSAAADETRESTNPNQRALYQGRAGAPTQGPQPEKSTTFCIRAWLQPRRNPSKKVSGL